MTGKKPTDKSNSRFQFTLSSLLLLATGVCLALATWHYANQPWMKLEIPLARNPSTQLLRDVSQIDGVTAVDFEQGNLVVEATLPSAFQEIFGTLRKHDIEVSQVSITQSNSMNLSQDEQKEPGKVSGS